MKNLALLLISSYQKYISPYKGYSCAYRVATGDVGCSGYGKKVIGRFGIIKGYALLKRRFIDCKICKDELDKEKSHNHKKRFNHSQRGDCSGLDCAIGDCGLPNPGDACLDLFGNATDAIECCDACSSNSSENPDEDDKKQDRKDIVLNKIAKAKKKNEEVDWDNFDNEET